MIKHRRIFSTVALTALLAVSLTGCLVKKAAQKPPTDRGSDNLHIYKNGEWIRYRVTSLVAGVDTPVTGTLEIRWTGPFPLTSPDKTMINLPVMKKVITMKDGSGSEYPEATVHYVYQDKDPNSPSYGTEYLVAMDDPRNAADYWLNSVGGSNAAPLDGVNRVNGGESAIVTQESPLYLHQSYDVNYYLMNQCSLASGRCNGDVGASTNTITVKSDSTPVNTNLGINYANPFFISFSGDVFPTGGNTSIPLLLNILDTCSAGISTRSGNMYVVPDIGVIQLESRCSASDGSTNISSMFIDSYFFLN